MTRELLRQRGYRDSPDSLRRDSVLWQKRIVDEGENRRGYLNINEATDFPDDRMKHRYAWDANLYIEHLDGLAMKIEWYSIPTADFDEAMLSQIEAEAVGLWRQFCQEAR